MSFHVPERYRVLRGRMWSIPGDGNNGAFAVPIGRAKAWIIASDGAGWEHVSVSFHSRIPTWDEMCKVKAIFWDAEDVVIQFHPRASEYVNNVENVLHMWRPTDAVIPTPPPALVGIKSAGVLSRDKGWVHMLEGKR